MYTEDKADKTWQKGDATFSIWFCRDHYCGYVRYPKRFTIESGYDGFLTYVPVHGGLTYTKEDTNGSIVYGFDCAHCDDGGNPLCRDLDWLTAECERMDTALRLAPEYEKRYLVAATNKDKAAIIEEYHAALTNQGIVFDLRDNLGAMINVVVGGQL